MSRQTPPAPAQGESRMRPPLSGAIAGRLQAWRRAFLHGSRRERGQSIVEFALAFPIFITVLFAVLEFAFIFTDQVKLINAARDGARAGAVPAGLTWSSRNTAATNAMTTSTGGLISCPSPTKSVTPTYGDAYNPTVATQVTVTVSCPYHPITPLGALVHYLGGGVNTTVTLTSTSEKMVEP